MRPDHTARDARDTTYRDAKEQAWTDARCLLGRPDPDATRRELDR